MNYIKMSLFINQAYYNSLNSFNELFPCRSVIAAVSGLLLVYSKAPSILDIIHQSVHATSTELPPIPVNISNSTETNIWDDYTIAWIQSKDICPLPIQKASSIANETFTDTWEAICLPIDNRSLAIFQKPDMCEVPDLLPAMENISYPNISTESSALACMPYIETNTSQSSMPYETIAITILVASGILLSLIAIRNAFAKDAVKKSTTN